VALGECDSSDLSAASSSFGSPRSAEKCAESTPRCRAASLAVAHRRHGGTAAFPINPTPTPEVASTLHAPPAAAQRSPLCVPPMHQSPEAAGSSRRRIGARRCRSTILSLLVYQSAHAYALLYRRPTIRSKVSTWCQVEDWRGADLEVMSRETTSDLVIASIQSHMQLRQSNRSRSVGRRC
jgi:hypothetical protein